MKIDVKEAKVTSNVPQDNVTVGSISVEGMEHIMTLLTNLYKDPELAVIREYYTNAVDAHVAAGVEKAVKITLPTWDNPVYTVQDYGIGMSRADINTIYIQYGASTKRKTNDQVGAFGLGCKSAMAITQQFTLISIKDYIKTTALIGKNESGVITVNIVSEVETPEGNGTTIKIPISTNTYGFNQKAHRFFAFSTTGSVIVDGRVPEYALDSAQRIEDPNDPERVIYLKARADGESYVIMGNVPYALSPNEIELSLSRLGVEASRGFTRMPKYFPIPIGSVDLTPSREGLRFTDKTNAVIDEYISFVVNDLKAIAAEEINASTSLGEFFKTFKSWNAIVEVERKFNGKIVPTEIQLDTAVRIIKRNSYAHTSHEDTYWVRLDHGGERIVVTGFSAENYKKVNSYLTPYMTSIGKTGAVFLVTDSKDIHTNEWVAMSEDFTFVDGNDIIEKGREQRKIERQAASKTNGTAKRSKISYPVLSVDDEKIEWVNHDEIDQSTPYLHLTRDLMGDIADVIRGAYSRIGYDQTVSGEVAGYFEAVTDAKEIILLGGSRTVKALEQRVKQTRSIISDIEKTVPKVKDLLTDEVVKHYGVSNSAWKRFLTSAGISATAVKDSDIVEIITPTKATVEAYQKFESTREALKFFTYRDMPSLPQISYQSTEKAVERLNVKYPLVNSLNTWNLNSTQVKHLIKYFNLIHEEQAA